MSSVSSGSSTRIQNNFRLPHQQLWQDTNQQQNLAVSTRGAQSSTKPWFWEQERPSQYQVAANVAAGLPCADTGPSVLVLIPTSGLG